MLKINGPWPYLKCHGFLFKIRIQIHPISTDDAIWIYATILSGHEHVVEMLLVARADPTLKMGDLTPLDIARDFGHDEILKLFESHGSS